MKKNRLFYLSLFVFAFSQATFLQTVRSQTTSDPSQWNIWVKDSTKNILIKDTFLIQNFEAGVTDTWGYSLSGEGTTCKDASTLGINGQKGSRSLWLPSGTTVTFAPVNLSGYSNQQTRVNFAGLNLKTGQNLECSFYRDNKTNNTTLNTVTQETANIPFKESSAIGRTSDLSLTVSPVASSQGGYFIDNVYINGLIPSYSLFTGTGNWNDSIRWSNLPPARRRNALIAGDATIQNTEQLNSLSIGNGSLTISPDAALMLDSTLILHCSDKIKSTFINKGSFISRERIQLITNFEEKGKWYFISFPFDVYSDGIDSRFTLKDSLNSQSGNYFYVQYYDGEQRANTGTDTANWKTIKASLEGNQLIFEKNKGYLIALDEGATQTSIIFSSNTKAVPSDFGKTGQKMIPHYSHQGNASSEHSGWYLCGNPLPAPLSLSQIQANTGLGNFIYWYNGVSYEVYDVGSNQSIPPYGAFFFKTSESKEFVVSSAENSSILKQTLANETIVPSFTIQLQNDKYKDQTVFRFCPEASKEIDTSLDAFKLMSLQPNVPQIGSYASTGKILAINTQPLTGTEIRIPLYIQTGESGNYTLNFHSENFEESEYSVELTDRQTGERHPLSNQNSYSFILPSGVLSDKYEVILQKTFPTSIPQINQKEIPSCRIQGKSLALFNLPTQGTVTIRLLTGQCVWQQQVPPGNGQIDLPLSRGSYLLQVQAGSFLSRKLFIITK